MMTSMASTSDLGQAEQGEMAAGEGGPHPQRCGSTSAHRANSLCLHTAQGVAGCLKVPSCGHVLCLPQPDHHRAGRELRCERIHQIFPDIPVGALRQ